MDTQTQLDLQFGLDPVIESIEESSLNAKVVDTDNGSLHSHPRKGRRHVSKSDEATTSAMNNLALKTVPKTAKQIPQEPNEGGPSVFPKRISMPEVHVTRLRKRKSQESPDPDIPAKKISLTKTLLNKEPTHKASKPAVGQLSRPSDPLNTKKLQSSGRSVPARDKFDILGEQSPKVRSKKIEQPEEQVKKPRGRPRKEDAVITRNPKIFDNLSSSAAVPKISRFSRRLHPDLDELESHEVLKDNELLNSKAKGSKHGIGFRLTRSTKGDLSGRDDLIVPDEWSKIPERRNKEQTQGNVLDEPMPAPISVPDSAAESQENEEQRQGSVPDKSVSAPISVSDSVAESQEDEDDSVIHEDKDGEVSDYGSNHLENPRALSDPGGEGQAVDQNTAQESNDSDEADQSSEDEDIASDCEEEDEPAFELFGGTKYWNQIIEGARTVGVSRLKDNVVSKRPKITTNTGQDLVELLQEVESMYKEISSSTGSAADTETVEHNLQSRLEDLEEIIHGLSESNAPEHDRLKSLLVQDVYAHAIPATVLMLRAALRCRTESYSEPNDTETLKEMVRIQELIIRLCDKARRWKAPPLTKRPIMGPVANKILPYMRDLKERCFGRELGSRRNCAKQKSEEQRFVECHKKMQEQKQLEKQKHRQKIEDQRRLIYQHLQQKPKGMGSRTQQSTPLDDGPQLHKRSHSSTSTQWTRGQNEDLVRELLGAETRDLPAQERYLAILNTPSLQNKLPEHIRDRALYYKDLLIQDLGPKDYVMSIE